MLSISRLMGTLLEIRWWSGISLLLVRRCADRRTSGCFGRGSLLVLSFAVNVTVNEDLSVSPYEVEHGRVPHMPFDTQFIEP